MSIVLRDLESHHLPALVELNNDAYPAVPIMDEDSLGALSALASLAIIAVDERDGDTPVGFLLAIDPGTGYASENYRFFEERDGSHLYVDRIVIDDEYRGHGIGPRLYEAVLEKAAADGRAEVTCEVNVQPPNPGSLRFHERLGFARVGQQETKGGSVVVALLAKPVVR